MKATTHPTNNFTFKAPPGTEAEISDLHVTRGHYGKGGPPVTMSYWAPSATEREALANGALVRFMCFGDGHPVIAIGVDGVDG